jgi:hypothetical protein
MITRNWPLILAVLLGGLLGLAIYLLIRAHRRGDLSLRLRRPRREKTWVLNKVGWSLTGLGLFLALVHPAFLVMVAVGLCLSFVRLHPPSPYPLPPTPFWYLSRRRWARRLQEEFEARDAWRMALITRNAAEEMPETAPERAAILAGLESTIPDYEGRWRRATDGLGLEPSFEPPEQADPPFDDFPTHMTSIPLTPTSEIRPGDIDWTRIIQEQTDWVKEKRSELRAMKRELRGLQAQAARRAAPSGRAGRRG